MPNEKGKRKKGRFDDIYVGPINQHPGILKAKADKLAREKALAEYRKKSAIQKANAINKAKANKSAR